MATKKRRGGRKAGGPNRSEFIREILTANPQTSAREVQEKWTASGNKDKLNPTLFYLVKSKLGLTSGVRGGRRAGRPSAAAGRMGRTGQNGGYLEIEQALDRLISQAEGLRDNKLADDLRQARRRASTALI